MEDNLASIGDSEKLQGINSLLAAGDIECDKCGATIRYLERYCCNSHECPTCGAEFGSAVEIEGHFSQQHSHEPPRGTRYCVDCSLRSGYLKIVRNKKLREIFPAMLTLRDEEEIESKPVPYDLNQEAE